MSQCPQCSKKVYETRRHAVWDARQLDRKHKSVTRMQVYRCPQGHWHVGRSTPPEVRQKHRAPRPKRWRWRQEGLS